MQFNCIDSNTTLGGHKGLFARLREKVAAEPEAKHVFIVPDRYTLGVEQEICEQCFPDGTFSVDVCSFTRFATKHVRNRKGLSKEGTVLLLNSVVRRCNERLAYYKDIRSVSFSRELFAAIASLRSSGIKPEDIRQNLAFLKEEGTKQKLQDIVLIYEEYEKALREKYVDTVSRVEQLTETAEQIEDISSTHLYVLGFNVYSAVQLKLLQKLLLLCPSVSIAFCKACGDEGGSNVSVYPSQHRSLFIDYCKANGVPIKFFSCNEELKAPFNGISAELFGCGKPTQLSLTREERERVRLFKGVEPYDEVKAACREIRHIVRSENRRYKDIAVLCNDESYLPVIKTMFKRFEIPYFSDEKYLVKDGFFVRFVKALFATRCSGYAVNDVMDLLSCPLSDVTREQMQIFENYCRKYNVRYTRMATPFKFGKDDVLQAAENTRQRIVEIVEKVPEDGSTASVFADLLLQILDSDEMKALRKKCEESEEDVLKAYSEIDKFKTVAEEIKELVGDIPCTAASFLEMFLSTVEGMSVSLLPQNRDCVFVGNGTESRFADVSCLFVLGAADGFFPMQKGDAVVLSALDCEAMKNVGLPVFPTPVESNDLEKFIVIDACTKADRLYIGCSAASVTNEALNESDAVRELKIRLDISETPLSSYYAMTDEEKLLYFLGTVENAYHEYMAKKVPDVYEDAVRELLIREGKIVSDEEPVATKEVVEAVKDVGIEEVWSPVDGYDRTKDGDYTMSVTRLEQYFACPFRHFLTDAVGLKPTEEGAMQANEKGNLIHDVLEHYFKDSRDVLDSWTEEDIRSRTEKAIEQAFDKPDYAHYKEDILSAYELDCLKEECRRLLKVLTENAKNSRFKPNLVEYVIGKNGELVIDVCGKKFVFTGKVDRLDRKGDSHEIMIIDYKTGKVEASLKDIYYGEKIQLYVYLHYFMQKGDEPVGVFYVPVKSGYTAKGNSYRMLGQMQKSADVLAEIDTRYDDAARTAKYESPTVGINIEEGGTFNGNTRNVVEPDDFGKITDYVQNLIAGALEDIVKGDIEKNPLKGQCEYCVYKCMCGQQVERATLDVKIQAFR